MEKPKISGCSVIFNCEFYGKNFGEDFTKCCYFKPDKLVPKYCDYLLRNRCTSSIAIVNRCVLTCKEHGINIENKPKMFIKLTKAQKKLINELHEEEKITPNAWLEVLQNEHRTVKALVAKGLVEFDGKCVRLIKGDNNV